MQEYILTFIVGILGSVVSALAGAGGGLVTSPYFILLGLPPQTAIATAKFGGIGMAFGTIGKFRKTKHIRWEFVWVFLPISLIAGFLGARLLLAINNELIRQIVAFAILLVVPVLLMGKTGIERVDTSKGKRGIGYGLLSIGQTIQAAFGSGLGVLTNIVYMHFFGMTAIEANATKRIPGPAKELVVIPTFIIAGVVSYGHGFAIMAGSLVGGFLGAHIAVKRGNKFVKIALSVVVVILALKLLINGS